MRKVFFALPLLLCSVLTFTSCDEETNNGGGSDTALKTVVQTSLSDVGDKVIMPTYKALYETAGDLYTACEALKKEPTDANMEKARKAWRVARVHWEQSEAFLWGPTADSGLDPALDTWPVDVPAMNAILNSKNKITREVVAANENTRGFHLVEFLLWGEDSNQKADKMTPRQLELLVAAADDIKLNAKSLIDEWTDHVKVLATAGQEGNLKYKSLKSALQELADGMNEIVNEVANEKIENPLNGEETKDDNGKVIEKKDFKPHFDLEESRFSNNSKQDYIDNLVSIKNVFNCNYNNKKVGKGLYDILTLIKKEDLAKDFNNKLDAAMKAIDAIPGTFTQGIKDHRAEVKKAQEAVREASKTLEEKIIPTINNSKELEF